VFVALGIQQAMRMRHIVICGLPLLQYFCTLSQNGTIFGGKKVTEHKMCVFILSIILPETFLILRTTERDVMQNVHRSSCKVPGIISDFNKTSIFSTDFGEKPQISNFMEPRLLEAELFHAGVRTDGQTDKTKIIVPFRNFANASKYI